MAVSWEKWQPLFPSHINAHLLLIWDGPSQSYLDGLIGSRVPGFHKHQTEMQPPSYVPAKTSYTTVSIKSFSADFSYKVMSPSLWHQSKSWFQQIPKSNQIFTMEISFSPLLSFVLFTKCLNHRLMNFKVQSCRPQFGMSVMQHNRKWVKNSSLLEKKPKKQQL